MKEITFVEDVVSLAAFVSRSVWPITFLFAVSFRPRRNCLGFIAASPCPSLFHPKHSTFTSPARVDFIAAC